jgi:hypothetical protein
MKSDYLWDGGDATGEPDPEIQQLERLLSEFRANRTVPELAAGYRPASARLGWSAIAASIAVAAAALWLASGTAQEGWQVDRSGSGTSRLAVGETLETGADGHATLNVGEIGVIEVEPNSRLRLIRAHKNEHRMALEHGLIHATIWAPPRSFVVDMPSAAAVDLGCSYTLEVSSDGTGLISVLSGWVSFERNGRESFIPAGALCRTRPGAGPGTPYREDASPSFRQALADFDFAHGADAALAILLKEAKKDDAFTLWHLLTRCERGQAPRVYDALAALAPPPAGVSRVGILRSDPEMLDRWWDALGLGDTSWWRLFEGKWPPSSGLPR